jgi:hypothetical protein
MYLPAFDNIHYLRGARGEDAIANTVAIELRALSAENKFDGVWFHVPNECIVKSKEDAIRLRRKCSIGMIPGAPDFVFLKCDKSLQVELKTDTGKLSDNQKEWQKFSGEHNVPYVVARSWDDVKSALEKEGFIKD